MKRMNASIAWLSVSALPLLLVLAFNGCEISCTTDIRTAMVITVVDSLTGGAPAAPGASIIVIDGAFRDSSRLTFPDNRIGLIGERPGVYRIEIHADGYRPWSRNNIRVGSDECHVRTIELRALLQRLPGGNAP